MTSAQQRSGDRRPRTATRVAAYAALVLASQAAMAADTEPLARILETARSFLAQSLTDVPGAETRIEIGQLDSRLRLARCAQPPSGQWAPGARQAGNTTVNVRCAGPVTWSIFVPVSIERHLQVVTTARALGRQQVIQPADVRLERQETSSLTSGYFTELSAVVGLEAKRRLIPGQVLTQTQVAPRQLIKRGQEVTIYAMRPGLTVRMKGEALENGSEGERIRVRNRSSKRIVEGYVEPSGAVRVAL
ncbi:flagellar basal body P-ring formation chaperone FlgA [Thiocystis violacea]|uniref:flagellar basal body P-ring formation chaperone FlgA n=1 Tax=Thiocystis violacea TaxID=13725 RepID=UPI00190731B6|nr:flagellar basal body P-ring formation chaperone FlgA [Thiocystis violacea]MBK1723677.1 flagella basal body P-ring formation protein FlgA [Thiocystis violacea]